MITFKLQEDIMDIAEYQHAEDMKRAAAYVLEYDLVSGSAEGIARAATGDGIPSHLGSKTFSGSMPSQKCHPPVSGVELIFP